VVVTVVGENGDDLSRIGRELADIGLRVVDEDIIRSHHLSQYDGFDRAEE
jgi:hypothetical protein